MSAASTCERCELRRAVGGMGRVWAVARVAVMHGRFGLEIEVLHVKKVIGIALDVGISECFH